MAPSNAIVPTSVESAALQERLNGLEKWQTAQNGTLRRLEEKLDRLIMWMMGATFAALLALAGVVFSLLAHVPPKA